MTKKSPSARSIASKRPAAPARKRGKVVGQVTATSAVTASAKWGVADAHVVDEGGVEVDLTASRDSRRGGHIVARPPWLFS